RHWSLVLLRGYAPWNRPRWCPCNNKNFRRQQSWWSQDQSSYLSGKSCPIRKRVDMKAALETKVFQDPCRVVRLQGCCQTDNTLQGKHSSSYESCAVQQLPSRAVMLHFSKRQADTRMPLPNPRRMRNP